MDARTRPQTAPVAAALAALYLIWGSTFLAIRVALDGFPPLWMASLRFLAAGALLFAVLLARGGKLPSARQWRGALCVGALLCGSNGLVVVAEQWVSTGLTAVTIGSVPLWAALFAGLFGRWPSPRDWLGIFVGFCGMALLQTGAGLRASPAGALALVVAAIGWALGSVWSRRLELPAGLMGSAAQMLCGGAVLALFALLHGEHFVGVPPPRALAAWGYLALAGSVIGYSAYGYLLRTVRPAVATSYAYVNPLVAVGLGALFLGEAVPLITLAALALILAGVGIVMAQRRQ